MTPETPPAGQDFIAIPLLHRGSERILSLEEFASIGIPVIEGHTAHCDCGSCGDRNLRAIATLAAQLAQARIEMQAIEEYSGYDHQVPLDDFIAELARNHDAMKEQLAQAQQEFQRRREKMNEEHKRTLDQLAQAQEHLEGFRKQARLLLKNEAATINELKEQLAQAQGEARAQSRHALRRDVAPPR